MVLIIITHISCTSSSFIWTINVICFILFIQFHFSLFFFNYFSFLAKNSYDPKYLCSFQLNLVNFLLVIPLQRHTLFLIKKKS